MKLVRCGIWTLVVGLAPWSAGCAPSWVPLIGKHPDMQIQSVTAIKTITIRRIAVMPLIEEPASPTDVVLEGSGETVTAELQSRLALEGGWQLVPESEVGDAMQKLAPPTGSNLQELAVELGRKVSADGVLYGKVEDFRERVGTDYAAASPAAVEFTLSLMDVHKHIVVWHVKFAKAQKALADNVFNLASFIKNSGRWVRAHEISNEGVEEAVLDLHNKLNLEKNLEASSTETYQQYQQGERRFNR